MWRKKVFWSANLSKATKMRMFRTLVLSVLLYGAETWTIHHTERPEKVENIPREVSS